MLCAGCGSILPPADSKCGLHYCDSCSHTYRGAAARMDMELVGLARSLGLPMAPSALDHEPAGKKNDFLIHHSGKDAAAAEGIRALLEDRGYKTELLAAEGAANFVGVVHDGLRRSRRLILLISPDYLRGPYGGREWLAFLGHDPDGHERLITLLRVAECPRDEALDSLRMTDLTGMGAAARRAAVLRALNCAAGEPVHAGAFVYRRGPEEQEAKGTGERLGPGGSEPSPSGSLGIAAPLVIVTGLAALLLLVPAVPNVMTVDVKLPLSWMLYDGNLREHAVIGNDPLPTRYWQTPDGHFPTFRRIEQALELQGTSLIRSSDTARDGIAQYTLAIEKGGVALLTRAAPGISQAYETRLEATGPGQLLVRAGFRNARKWEPIPQDRTSPVEVGNRARHEVAISMQGDMHTVWLNGRSVVTFRDKRLPAGAVGLRVGDSDQVNLFRWSVNLDVDNRDASATLLLPRPWMMASAGGFGVRE